MGLRICPVHACTNGNFYGLAHLGRKILSGMMQQLLIWVGFEVFLHQKHLLHILRIGACQTATDSGEDAAGIAILGRWRSVLTVMLYQHDCKARPGQVRFSRWPVRAPLVLSDSAAYEQIKTSGGPAMLMRKIGFNGSGVRKAGKKK